MKTSGFPVVAEPSGASVLPAAFRVINPTPEKSSPGEIVSRCLRQLAGAAVVVVDSDGRFYASEDVDEGTAMLEATVNASYGGTPVNLTLTPEGGSKGIAVKWDVNDVHASWFETWHLDFTTPPKPLRSLASLIDRFNRSLGLFDHAFFVVDQSGALLHYLKMANHAHVREAMDALAESSDTMLVIDLLVGTGAGNTNQPFENPR